MPEAEEGVKQLVDELRLFIDNIESDPTCERMPWKVCGGNKLHY